MPFDLRRFLCAFSTLLALSLTNYLSAQDKPAQDQAPQTQPSQTQPPQTQAQPVHESATVMRATTRMVVVDVVATDHSGTPVTDLKPEDFTVLEDGSPQQVRSFSFQHPADVAAADPAPLAAPEL